jgi:hypothetical protein
MTNLQKAVLAFLVVFLIGVACLLGSAIYYLGQPRVITENVPVHTPLPTVEPTPMIVEGGQGQQIVNFKVDNHGRATYILASHHTDRDTAPFIVNLFSDNGERLDLVFFQSGPARGLTSRQNLEPGLYYLEVTGEEWNIVIGPA